MADRLFEVTATGILYVHPLKLRAAQQKVMIFNMPSKQLQISKTLPAMRDSLFFSFSFLLPFQDQFLLQKYCPRAVCLKAPAPSQPHPRSSQTHGPLAGNKGGWGAGEGGVGWRLRAAIESFRWWSLMPVIIQHTQGTPADDDVSDVPGQD